MALYSFRIAAGWNVALGSLTNVEELPAQSGYKHRPPAISPGYDDGLEKYPGNGGLYLSGYPFVPWYMGDWRYPLWYYFYNTIGGGLRRSKVTIYTLTKPGLTTYTRYNAWMHLPKPEHAPGDFNILPNYTIYMLRLTTPS